MKTKRKRNVKSKKATRRTRLTTRRGTLDIENGLGRMKSARAIAQSLKHAADASSNLKAAPLTAAMAAIDHLIAFLDKQKARLEAAKVELRKLYNEPLDEKPASPTRASSRSRRRSPSTDAKRRRNGETISARPT